MNAALSLYRDAPELPLHNGDPATDSCQLINRLRSASYDLTLFDAEQMGIDTTRLHQCEYCKTIFVEAHRKGRKYYCRALCRWRAKAAHKKRTANRVAAVHARNLQAKQF